MQRTALRASADAERYEDVPVEKFYKHRRAEASSKMKNSEYSKGSGAEKATTDEYLRTVTIGERKPHNDTIHLASYDPNWPLLFERLASRVRNALSGKVILLEHVGSTSIPGLSAKPVIDMVLAVADSMEEPSYIPLLEAEGFVLRIREPDWFEHRLLRASDINSNLHVFSAGCDEIDRMLTFRNWLRIHDVDRRLYETSKHDLAARTWKHIQNYSDAKSEVIENILARARGSSLP
jgi:GrpB-like predicted nucleotidyltransferase (UPF0157 family)